MKNLQDMCISSDILPVLLFGKRHTVGIALSEFDSLFRNEIWKKVLEGPRCSGPGTVSARLHDFSVTEYAPQSIHYSTTMTGQASLSEMSGLPSQPVTFAGTCRGGGLPATVPEF